VAPIIMQCMSLGQGRKVHITSVQKDRRISDSGECKLRTFNEMPGHRRNAHWAWEA
jgi:hypothetical protein